MYKTTYWIRQADCNFFQSVLEKLNIKYTISPNTGGQGYNIEGYSLKLHNLLEELNDYMQL